ncbi:MAG: 30S ribosomal protein S17 [Microbacteriaceae bacterium]|nr:30S ribosomal protein S17 [Microbacteriaceae bacterium]
MATAAESFEQKQNAFQKQPTIFLGRVRILGRSCYAKPIKKVKKTVKLDKDGKRTPYKLTKTGVPKLNKSGKPILFKRKQQKAPKRRVRFVRNVGLGFKTPELAVRGNYIDKKCPFVGNVSIRGRILRGVVASTKMERTIIVRRDYLHYIRKYQRYEKRHKNIAAHLSPCFEKVEVGDVVTIGECRPLSKTIRFNVLKVEHSKITGLQKKKQFRIF